MRPKTIAEHAADILRETNKHSVGYGDAETIEAIAARYGMEQTLSARERQARVLSALQISPLFEMQLVDIREGQRGKRQGRSFTLVGAGPQAADEIAQLNRRIDILARKRDAAADQFGKPAVALSYQIEIDGLVKRIEDLERGRQP